MSESNEREQELRDSWWELISENLYESFLKSHTCSDQRRTRVDKSCQARFVWEFSQLSSPGLVDMRGKVARGIKLSKIELSVELTGTSNFKAGCIGRWVSLPGGYKRVNLPHNYEIAFKSKQSSAFVSQ